MRIKARQLKGQGIGKYIIVSRQDTPLRSVVKVIDVITDTRQIVLEHTHGEEEGKQFFAYYNPESDVDIYEEDEAMFAAFNAYNDDVYK